MNTVSALIVSAGEGKRIGSDVPKPYIKLKGVPILALTLRKFDEHPEIENIIVVTHPRWLDYCKSEIVEKFGFNKVKSIIQGGQSRQDSVRLGLEVLPTTYRKPLTENRIVLIHDAVRPFITQEFVTHLIDITKKYKAVVPGVPVTNTIKEIEEGFVCRTVQRDKVYEIQTPQAFSLDIIKRAHTEAYKNQFYATDDSALVERLGIQVKVIHGLPQNIKITTKDDLLFAECLMLNAEC